MRHVSLVNKHEDQRRDIKHWTKDSLTLASPPLPGKHGPGRRGNCLPASLPAVTGGRRRPVTGRTAGLAPPRTDAQDTAGSVRAAA